jgi:Butirosin biosynthesis protein H, N-terminal/Domain of unknown function (DUF4872)
MTTRKGFKRLVRARAAKTGESYATARRVILGEAGPSAAPSSADMRSGRRGIHPDTAAMATVLGAKGVVSPITGRPLSEALLLVAGGGLGAGYILWEFEARKRAVLVLGFRNQWQYPAIPGWFGKTTERLGVPTVLHETSGAKAAREALETVLADGSPVVATVDQQTMGLWGLPPELSGYAGYPVVVTGKTEDGAYLVDDRGSSPFVIPAEVMAAARGRVGSYRNRLIELRPTAGPIPTDRLRDALVAGLADQVDHLSSASDSFSLPAWRKWSRLMTDRRNAKGWPRVFAAGHGLFDGLISMVEQIDEGVSAWGGHLRDLYADGLEEAAAILDRTALREAAEAWRASADLWQELADAAVPRHLDGAADAVELAEELHDAVMRGEPGRAQARTAAAGLWDIRDRYANEWPLAEGDTDVLLADLGRRLAAIHAAERTALDTTGRAIGR